MNSGMCARRARCSLITHITVGDLVDADAVQPVQPRRVQLVVDHPSDDRADRAPVDTAQPGHRGLVRPRRQPRDEILEVGDEPRPYTRERRPLGDHAMLGAAQPSQPGPHQQLPRPEIQRRQVDSTGRVSYRFHVVHPQCGQTSSNQRSLTMNTISSGANATAVTQAPTSANILLNAAVTRTASWPLVISCGVIPHNIFWCKILLFSHSWNNSCSTAGTNHRVEPDAVDSQATANDAPLSCPSAGRRLCIHQQIIQR